MGICANWSKMAIAMVQITFDLKNNIKYLQNEINKKYIDGNDTIAFSHSRECAN